MSVHTLHGSLTMVPIHWSGHVLMLPYHAVCSIRIAHFKWSLLVKRCLVLSTRCSIAWVRLTKIRTTLNAVERVRTKFERCWTMFSTSLNEFEQNSNEFERVWTNLNCLRPCTAIWFSCVVCFCLGCVTLFSYPNLTYFVCVRNNLHWSFCIKVFDSFSEIFSYTLLRFFHTHIHCTSVFRVSDISNDFFRHMYVYVSRYTFESCF